MAITINGGDWNWPNSFTYPNMFTYPTFAWATNTVTAPVSPVTHHFNPEVSVVVTNLLHPPPPPVSPKFSESLRTYLEGIKELASGLDL